MSHSQVRDFIYLDIERVRSFLAQLSGGLTSERTRESQHQTGGQTEAKGGIPLIAEAKGGVDYHYLRSQSETISLHDQIFEEMFSKLESANYLIDMSKATQANWIPGFFHDGMFVVCHSPLKIVDYQTTVSALQGLPSLTTLLGKVTGAQGSNKSQKSSGVQQHGRTPGQPGSATSQANMRQIQAQIQSLPLKPTADLVAQLYKDIVRVKVFPIMGHSDMVFVGTADRSHFRYTPERLISLFGPVIDANWVSLLQVNLGTPRNPGELISQTGNAVEDGLEQLADFLASLNMAPQRIEFPAVAVTPIAIYRDIAPNR